jgi:Ni,Fe-hydrogenase III large subunit/Ni,Fe-hydrogenase III component G
MTFAALSALDIALQRLPAPLPMWRGRVDDARWNAAAQTLAAQGARLVSLWASRREVEPARAGARNVACAAYATSEGLLWLELPVAEDGAGPPDLTAHFACAARMQRAMADLSGVRAKGSRDQRPWLDHGLWPADRVPLQTVGSEEPARPGTLPADYRFVRVEGDGVHEIAVGPVHAGIIEPGHFRFSVVGEKVLRLEAHLGYVHKGIERRFTELPPLQAHRLAGRVSGDSTVAYAWSYCMALESAWQGNTPGHEVPERAQWLRALMLERERVANHLGDLGALGNDAALAFGLAQFSRLREDWQRLSHDAFGHRFMMDAIVPGGVAADLSLQMRDRLQQQCDVVEREVRTLRVIYDEHAGLQDRFLTTGRVTPELAAQLGLAGLAGRASGQPFDLRSDHAWHPYPRFSVQKATQLAGDVAARVAVRFDEVFESLRLIRALCSGLPQTELRIELVAPASASAGAGWVEGWRGEVFVALETGAAGQITRCHCHDPSWQNWPVLEHAVIGNIVPDFPLINKSFNLSYSGHDL